MPFIFKLGIKYTTMIQTTKGGLPAVIAAIDKAILTLEETR